MNEVDKLVEKAENIMTRHCSTCTRNSHLLPSASCYPEAPRCLVNMDRAKQILFGNNLAIIDKDDNVTLPGEGITWKRYYRVIPLEETDAKDDNQT